MEKNEKEELEQKIINADFKEFAVIIVSVLKEFKDELLLIQDKVLKGSKTEYLTTKEVAQYLKCDVSTVNNWAKSKRLIKNYIGGRVYYKLSEVDLAVIRI